MSWSPFFRALPIAEAFKGITRCWVWEPPRLRGARKYVIGADVGDGLGRDFSVLDVVRCPTIEEPAEEVAQFISNRVSTQALAYAIRALGRWYLDESQFEAQAVIECNNHGLAVQDTLQLHLGYGHFYRWEYYDAADPAKRYSTKIGWVTNDRTRPLMLAKFHGAITRVDPLTQQPDFRLNSPVTIDQLRDFRTDEDLGKAAASSQKHDDAIMAAAIGYYAAWRLTGGEILPLDDRRRTKHLAELAEAAQTVPNMDYRNCDSTAEEQHDALGVRWEDRAMAETLY
jgi:hypothetical protein